MNLLRFLDVRLSRSLSRSLSLSIDACFARVCPLFLSVVLSCSLLLRLSITRLLLSLSLHLSSVPIYLSFLSFRFAPSICSLSLSVVHVCLLPLPLCLR